MAAAEPESRPTLCHGIVLALATSLRSHAASRRVELTVADGIEDVVVRTDRKVLGTILRSLIRNVIDGAWGGKVDIRVARGAVNGGRSVEFHVCGFASLGGTPAGPADKQAPSLSEIRELAARLRGQISVHVRAGEGSSYVLQLPEI